MWKEKLFKRKYPCNSIFDRWTRHVVYYFFYETPYFVGCCFCPRIIMDLDLSRQRRSCHLWQNCNGRNVDLYRDRAFRFAEGMVMMLPASIPLRKPLVYFTGIIEVVAGIGLLLPTWTKLYGWLLILFLILVLPANFYASLKRVDYEKATYGGPGPSYLWFRVPLQIFFIVWVYYFAVLNAPGLSTHILHNFLRVHS